MDLYYKIYEDICVNGKYIKSIYWSRNTKRGCKKLLNKWKKKHNVNDEDITEIVYNNMTIYQLNDGNQISFEAIFF